MMHAMSNLVATSMAVGLLLGAISPTVRAASGTATANRNTTASALLPPFGTNHTVGDGAGWLFDTKANASAANYSAWAANRTFYLGDYLSFKTRTDNTVVHTTNATVYKLCGYDGGAIGGGWKAEEAFLTVMLAAEGANYFFSDAGEGEHCRRGMRFDVTVARGRGLPQVPPSYYEPLSGGTAGTGLGEVVPIWVAVNAAFAALLML
ncbi:cucumber peeling cupredoxin-like [Hordeum vulgare subsp. vulgare]|uniref:Phytocyanin domain-containing protein n=1 Tax=Hordeum vulgare subsp. vulgare TaxID=112509 RepID=A0A8I6XGP5_HORVV|nr:cucumber peeling cupredoxin-like [Hordeum vulgare subsp. vulgare]KAI4993757.1 hypothetical protein ZWY2020_008070 [Hordeum vulgare]